MLLARSRAISSLLFALALSACPNVDDGPPAQDGGAARDGGNGLARDGGSLAFDGGGLGSDGGALDGGPLERVDGGIDAGPAIPAPGSELGATVYDGGVDFRVWAPHARSAALSFDADAGASPMVAEDGGTFSRRVPGVAAGQRYRYQLTTDGGVLWRQDPRGRQVLDPDSVVVDPSTYPWTAAPFTPPAPQDAIVYELHVGGFAGAGEPPTFRNVIAHLDHLAALGVTIVELMPVNQYRGRGWGYAPQGYFAPQAAYGTPDDLRALVDAAHARGIGVWLDVVYNHTDGSQSAPLRCFDGDCAGNAGIYYFPDAPYSTTPWGPRPYYASPEVGQFLVDSVALWLREYRVDGFRFDSTSNIRALDGQGEVPGGKDFLRRATATTHALRPGALAVAEDLKGYGAMTQPASSGGLGFDAQWDGFGYALNEAVIASSDDARNVLGLRDGIAPSSGEPFQRLLFVDNHDLAGNGSTRLASRIDGVDPGSWAARKRTMLAAGVLFTTPGIPMLFMGQELLERGSFTSSPPVLDWSKVQSYGPVLAFHRDLIRLRRNQDGVSAGLRCAGSVVHHVNESAKVLGWRRFCGEGGEVIVLANFRNRAYTRYDVGVPTGGVWHVRLNSDDRRYSTDFGGASSADLSAIAGPKDGFPYAAPVVLGPYSVVVLSQ